MRQRVRGNARRAIARGIGMKDGKYVILCVDDDRDVLMTLRIMLERNGYVMVEAMSAEDGVRVYKESKPDLLIIDLMMESVDAGRTFVKEVQLLGNRAPLYMLSSVGEALARNVEFADLGLSGVFQKPVEINTLLSTLKARLTKTGAATADP